MDILKYQPLISKITAKQKGSLSQKEDLVQECYLALLQREKELERATNDMAYAAVICWNRLKQIKRKENQLQSGHKTLPQAKFESLSIPRIYRAASKVPAPGQPSEIGDELDEAIQRLSPEEREVIQKMFIEDKTWEETETELGISHRALTTRRNRALTKMREYFEVMA